MDENQQQGWDGSGTHVRENCEGGRQPTASLHKELTPEQAAKFESFLAQKQTWTKEYHCAHWARDAWQQTTGEKLEVVYHMKRDGINTQPYDLPAGLEQSMREHHLEKENPNQALHVAQDKAAAIARALEKAGVTSHPSKQDHGPDFDR